MVFRAFSRSLVSTILIALTWAPVSTRAEDHKPIDADDSLDILVKSPAYSEFEYNSVKLKRKTRSRSVWMDPDSEYASLFANQKGIANLVDWTAPYIQGYTKFDVDTEKTPDYVRAFAKYAARDDMDLFSVNILVPHPRNLGTANLNLIEAFKKAREVPPDLVKSQIYKVRGLDAQVYSAKDDSCLLLLNLKKGALMQIRTKQCKTTDRLLDFARSLDITRLNRKLES